MLFVPTTQNTEPLEPTRNTSVLFSHVVVLKYHIKYYNITDMLIYVLKTIKKNFVL